MYASFVELWHDGRCVARHERCYSRQQQVLDLEHYLDVLSRKPGALAGSRPLEQQRRAGLWPESFDEIWQALMTRHGKQTGTKQMIETVEADPGSLVGSMCGGDRNGAGNRLHGHRGSAASGARAVI